MARTSDKPAERFLPVKIDTAASKKKLDDAERVGIFEIDGTVYDMSTAQRAELGLEYLRLVSERGDDAAAYYLISEALGREAYAALAAVEGLEAKTFDGIVARIQRVTMPEGKAPKGKG